MLNRAKCRKQSQPARDRYDRLNQWSRNCLPIGSRRVRLSTIFREAERDARCVHRLNTAFPSNRNRSIAFNRPSDWLNRFCFRRIRRLRSATPKFDYGRTLLRYNRITCECIKRAFFLSQFRRFLSLFLYPLCVR